MNKQTPPRPYQRRYGLADPPSSCIVHGRNSARNIVTSLSADTPSFADPKTGLVNPRLATTQQSLVADALADTGVLWSVNLFNVTADTGHGFRCLTSLTQDKPLDRITVSRTVQRFACLIRSEMLPTCAQWDFRFNSNPPDAANSDLARQTESRIENYRVI